jgi:sugar lactone lactonase YvrE
MLRHQIKLVAATFKHTKQTMLIRFIVLISLLPGIAHAWSSHQSATLELGQPNFISGQPNNTMRSFLMNYPNGIAIDSAGTLWVADTFNNRVLRYASAASLTNGAPPDSVLGQPDITSTAAATTQTGMSRPWGIAVDKNGTLWVADAGNNRVLRFAHATSKANGAKADSVLGQPSFFSSDKTTTQKGMSDPSGVTVDSIGSLWVVDAGNNRVLRFANAASKANGTNADDVLGQPNFVSSTAAATQSGMGDPSGVTVDNSGNLWVADAGNGRVLRFANPTSKANGANADNVLDGMDRPDAVAVDSNGTLWVADGNRVLRFANVSSKTNGATADGVLGQADLGSNSLPNLATQNGMSEPYGIAVDISGTLWVADTGHSRVLRFASAASKANGANADGVLGQLDFVSKVDSVSQFGLYNPQGVAVDPTTGKVFVADTYNHRVLRFASVENLSNGSAAEAVLGEPDFVSYDPGQGPTQNGMSGPFGVAVDKNGTLWVADAGNNQVLRYDHAASKANGADADGTLDLSDAPAQNGMKDPTAVAVDGSGTLWVVDKGNDRVLRFDNAAAIADGANADGVLGQPDFGIHTAAAATTQNGMDDPTAVAVDGSGTLWVVDKGNNRVLRFDNAASKANGANADGVLGQPNFVSYATATTQNGLYLPLGVAVDSSGTLWVADQYNSRVLRFDNAASKTNGANADGVLGQPDFSSYGSAVTQNGMYLPTGVAVDSSGSVWVVDSGNNRVLKFVNKP